MISCSNGVNKFFENQRLMVLKYFWWTWVSGHEMSVKFILIINEFLCDLCLNFLGFLFG